MFAVLSIEDAAKLLDEEPSWKKRLHREYANFREIAQEIVDNANQTIEAIRGESELYGDGWEQDTYEEIVCEEVDEMDERDAGKAVVIAMCGVSPDILLS